MTRPETRRASRKKPLGIGILFTIILFLLNLIGLVAVIVSFVNPIYNFFIELPFVASHTNFLQNTIVRWAQNLIATPYSLPFPFNQVSATQSAFMYFSAFYEVGMVLLLFLYFPFAVIGHNRIVNKKNQGVKLALQVISIILMLGYIVFVMLVSLSNSGRFGPHLEWFSDIFDKVSAYFNPGRRLEPLAFIKRFSPAVYTVAYAGLVIGLISLILNFIGLSGRNNYYITGRKAERQPEPYRQLDPLGRRVPAGYGAIKLAPIPSAEHIVVVEPGQKPVLPKNIAPAEPQRKVVPVSYVPSADRAPDVPVPAPKPELVTVSTENIEKKPTATVNLPTAERGIEEKPEPVVEKPVEKKLETVEVHDAEVVEEPKKLELKEEPKPDTIPAPEEPKPEPETKPEPEPKKEEPELVPEPKTEPQPLPEVAVPEPEMEPLLLKTAPVPEPELVPQIKTVATVVNTPANPQPEPKKEETKPVEIQPAVIPEPVPEKVEEKKEEVKPEPVPPAAPVAPVPPVPPVAPKAPEPEPEPEPERAWIQPTYREVSILNALEPILPNDNLTLPAVRETNVEAVLSNLEPFETTAVETLPSEESEIEEATKKANTISPENTPVDYLPGIDDNIVSPWEEEKPVEKTEVTQAAEPEPEPEEPVIEEKECAAPVEEEKPAEEEQAVEEAAEEEKVEEPVEPESTTPIRATIFPDAEPVEENVTEEAEAEAEEKEEEVQEIVPPVVEATSEEEKAEEPAEEEKAEEAEAEAEAEEEVEEEKAAEVTAINHLADDGLRPQEEDHPDNEIVRGPSRYEERITLAKNDLDEKQSTTIDEGWTIPGYEEKSIVIPVVEEAKEEEVEKPAEEEKPVEPVEEKKEEASAPVEEEKVEETTVVAEPVEEKKEEAVEENAPEPPVEENEPIQEKRTFTLVDPMKREVVEEKVEEKKELSAISGPLHKIRERKRDIQLVAPTKVKFDLKQYKVKTYEGDLTPEEAFLKGVTKVQPVVNPIFANQPVNDSWKQKKIDEENKKSGYFNVSQGKLVKPTRPLSQKPTNAKITSIRDMVKARKAKEPKEEEKNEK